MQAAAARGAQGQNLAAYSNAANQFAQLRAGEMEAGRQGFFGATSGMRGQDIGAAQFQSDQELANRAANDQRAIGFLGLGQRTLEGERGRMMQQQESQMGDYEGSLARARQEEQAQRAETARDINTVGSGTLGVWHGIANMNQPRPYRRPGEY